jgi:hypothetical protein
VAECLGLVRLGFEGNRREKGGGYLHGGRAGEGVGYSFAEAGAVGLGFGHGGRVLIWIFEVVCEGI